MKKVLVTGATGFLGSYILRLFHSKGYKLRAIKRENSSTLLIKDIVDDIEWFCGDVTDLPFMEEAISGVDWIIHAAATVSFDSNDKIKMMSVNVGGTENVVNLSLEFGIEKILHVSSIAALGRKENHSIIDENAQWENSKYNSDYAISKFKAECEVWRGIQEGLKAVIINPSLIMGAGFWHLGTCKMIKQAEKGLLFYPKGGNGFVDVRDVAEISLKLLESDISGQRYIINEDNYLFKNAFSIMSSSFNQKGPKIKSPDWLIDFIWRAEGIKSIILGTEPLITKELARGLQTFFQYDNSKIRAAFNHKFRSLEETISDVVNTYQKSKIDNISFGTLDF